MKIPVRVLLSLLMLLATLFLANCSPYGCRVTFGNSTCTASGSGITGGGGTGGGGGGGGGVNASSAAALVYYNAASIDAAGVTSTGTFGTLNSYTAPTLPANVADDMLIVNKHFLYVPTGGTTVEGFSINRSTGALTVIPGSPFSVTGSGATADDVATDPSGRFLFVGSETLTDIWVFQISPATGALTMTAGSPFSAGLSFVSDVLTVDAAGKFLYAGQTDPTLGVAGYSIDQVTGALTALAGSPFALGVAQLHASPTAGLLLGTAEIQDGHGGGTDPHIHVFSINASTGVPTAVPGSPFLTSSIPFDFAISPNGNFVYALEAVVGTGIDVPLQGFQLNSSTGALTSIGTFSGVPTAEGCRFDQSGALLFCIDTLFGATITVNSANASTGALTHVADLPVSSNFPFAVTD